MRDIRNAATVLGDEAAHQMLLAGARWHGDHHHELRNGLTAAHGHRLQACLAGLPAICRWLRLCCAHAGQRKQWKVSVLLDVRVCCGWGGAWQV